MPRKKWVQNLLCWKSKIRRWSFAIIAANHCLSIRTSKKQGSSSHDMAHILKVWKMRSVEEAVKVTYLYIFVHRLFEEKRRGIIFGIPSLVLPKVAGVYFVCATPLQFYADSFETNILTKVWINTCVWVGYNPQIFRFFSSVITIKVYNI